MKRKLRNMPPLYEKLVNSKAVKPCTRSSEWERRVRPKPSELISSANRAFSAEGFLSRSHALSSPRLLDRRVFEYGRVIDCELHVPVFAAQSTANRNHRLTTAPPPSGQESVNMETERGLPTKVCNSRSTLLPRTT